METLKNARGITIKHGGLEFSGRTLTDAKANRDAWLDQLGNRPSNPSVVIIAGVTLIVSCDCTTTDSAPWSYRLAYPANINGDGGGAWGGSIHGGFSSEALAQEAGRKHIAQTVYVPGRGAATVRDIPNTAAGRAEIESWCGWQDRYAAARARGLSDHDAREAA